MKMLGHMLPGWQCLPTYCQDDTAEAHWFGIWHYYIHHNLLISHPLSNIVFLTIWTLFYIQKTFQLKGEVETAFEDFLVSKPLEVYHTDINKLVDQWQKCIGVQGSYFDRFKLFKYIDLGIKVYNKIGYYFPNNLILIITCTESIWLEVFQASIKFQITNDNTLLIITSVKSIFSQSSLKALKKVSSKLQP